MQPPQPPEFDALTIFKWIAERLIYFAVVGFLFFGSLIALIAGNQDEGELPIPRSTQFAYSLFGITVIALIMYLVMEKFNMHPLLVCFLCAFFGLGTSKVSYWLLSIWRHSKGFISLARILGRIVGAVRKVIKEANEENPLPPAQ